MTELRLEKYPLMAALLGPENPLPIFRHPNPNHEMSLQDSLPPEKRELAGWQAGFRVLPYRMQDQYSRERQEHTFQAVVLENEHLRAIFLPELGGRLVSLIHLPEERELLSRNPVFQPANLAIRNAWFSGGIEWNIGHYGHTFTTCAPVFAAEIRGLNGDPGLRLYEYERCKGLFWQIDFYLPPGSPLLIAYTRVSNCSRGETPFYWWTNTAVPERPGVRVLAPEPQVIYVDFTGPTAGYGWGELPHLATLDADASYSTHFTYASEYFFQLDHAPVPWEAALDEQGAGFFEASTTRLRNRKMFCWGQHAGGRRWQQFLSLPGNDYLEIQAGLAPTQGHGLRMPANTAWDWLQVFGLFQGDGPQVHQPDYASAIHYVDTALRTGFHLEELERLRSAYEKLAEIPSNTMIRTASGWGALEAARREQTPGELPIPSALVFPAETLGKDQHPWLQLLRDLTFPDPDPAETPGEWMIQPEWLAILDSLPHPTWFSRLHEGVMRMEEFDADGAVAAWKASIRLRPSAWAYRNLASAAQRNGEVEAALAYYDQARILAVKEGVLPAGLAVECLQALCAAGRFAEAQGLLDALPDEQRAADRIQILSGRIALELGDLAAVERVLQREYAVIREGETELTDLWADMWLKRETAQTGQPADLSRQAILEKYPPPQSIDFRMF